MIIEPEMQLDRIVADTGLDVSCVRTVLMFELEYMAVIGIASPPLDYEFLWYERDPDRLPDPGWNPWVDTLVMARECERLTGVSESVAHQVFGAEMVVLEELGLA